PLLRGGGLGCSRLRLGGRVLLRRDRGLVLLSRLHLRRRGRLRLRVNMRAGLHLLRGLKLRLTLLCRCGGRLLLGDELGMLLSRGGLRLGERGLALLRGGGRLLLGDQFGTGLRRGRGLLLRERGLALLGRGGRLLLGDHLGARLRRRGGLTLRQRRLALLGGGCSLLLGDQLGVLLRRPLLGERDLALLSRRGGLGFGLLLLLCREKGSVLLRGPRGGRLLGGRCAGRGGDGRRRAGWAAERRLLGRRPLRCKSLRPRLLGVARAAGGRTHR